MGIIKWLKTGQTMPDEFGTLESEFEIAGADKPMPVNPGGLVYGSDSVEVYAGKSIIPVAFTAVNLGASASLNIDFATAGFSRIVIGMEVTTVTGTANITLQGSLIDPADNDFTTYGSLNGMNTNAAATGTKWTWDAVTAIHRILCIPGPIPPFMRINCTTAGASSLVGNIAYQLIA